MALRSGRRGLERRSCYQQVSVGRNYAGSACDVLVTDGLLQFWVGNDLLKTVARTSKGPVRKLHADSTAPRRS